MEKEMKEDDEDEDDEQLMKLFFTEEEKRKGRKKRKTAVSGQERHLKELYTLCRRHGCRRLAHARKKTRTDSLESQKAACAKLHRQLAAQKRRRRQAVDRKRISVSDIFEDAIAMKMFQSVFDPEDIIEDWSWNLNEAAIGDNAADTLAAAKEIEDIFSDWRWNMENKEQAGENIPQDKDDAVKVRFYDTCGIDEGFNDFNFWRMETELVDLFPLEEDAWSLWTEWGSVNEILANTLAAELPLEEVVEVADSVLDLQKMQEFLLSMKKLGGRRNLEEDEDHWSLWTEWGSVDEILDNTLEVGEAAAGAEEDEEDGKDMKDEDLDSGFLGDTEEEAIRWTDCQFWEDSYDNESILKSLMDDEIVEKAQSIRPVAYWDESLRENRDILEALLQEDPPHGVVCSKKRKFTEDEDEDIIFLEDEKKDEEEQSQTFKGLKAEELGRHLFWETANNNNIDDDNEADAAEGLCSCESGIFWLSTEDNRLIAESLVAEQNAMAGTALWEAGRENSEIARALVGGDYETRALISGDNETQALIGGGRRETEQLRKEAEDYFQDWRRNLSSPKKSR